MTVMCLYNTTCCISCVSLTPVASSLQSKSQITSLCFHIFQNNSKKKLQTCNIYIISISRCCLVSFSLEMYALDNIMWFHMYVSSLFFIHLSTRIYLLFETVHCTFFCHTKGTVAIFLAFCGTVILDVDMWV